MHISQEEDLCKVAGEAEETAVLSASAAASAKKKKQHQDLGNNQAAAVSLEIPDWGKPSRSATWR